MIIKHSSCVCSLARRTLVGKALSFTHELSFFSYQSTVLSSRAVDDHQGPDFQKI